MLKQITTGVAAMLLTCGIAVAQQGYRITGTISGLHKPSKVFLSYPTQRGYFIDSVILQNGKFAFAGVLALPPVKAMLRVKSLQKDTGAVSLEQLLFTDGERYFYLGNEVVTVQSGPRLAEAVITGGKAQADFRKLQSLLKPYADSSNAIRMRIAAMAARKDTAGRQALREQVKPLSEAMMRTNDNFMAQYPDSDVSLDLFNDKTSHETDLVSQEPLFNKLSERVRSSPKGKLVSEKIASIKRTSAGQPALYFTIPDEKDRPFSLAALKGKYVLVDFWASWCKPCREENPNLLAAYRRLKDRNFEIVSVSLDEVKASWLKAVVQDSLPWIQLSDLKGAAGPVATAYGINVIPQNVLVSPDGRIIARNLRGAQLGDKLAVLIGAPAADAFTITGTVQGLQQPSKVVLQYPVNGRFVFDSANIENGHFMLKGSLPVPFVKASLTIKPLQKPPGALTIAQLVRTDRKEFYLENAAITVTANSSIKKGMISGGQVQQEYLVLESRLQPYELQLQPFTQTMIGYLQQNDKEGRERLLVQMKPIQDAISRQKDSFIHQYPDSYVSFDLVKLHALAIIDPVTFEPMFSSLSERLRHTKEGEQLAAKLAKAKQTAVGQTALYFTQNDASGKAFSLSSLKGKYVLVDFWASWCKPCRAENPNLLKAWQALQQRNFLIVSVSLDTDRAQWLQAIAQDKLPWLQLSDLQGKENAAARLYGISAIPQNALIDPDGKIIARNLRGEQLTEKLSALVL